MNTHPQPCAENRFLAEHAVLLRRSLRHWTDRDLLPSELTGEAAARWLFEKAPFAVVSHDASPDPRFNYGNRTALQLFELSWQEFTALPSRLSAEPVAQAERERLLAAVARRGYLDDYSGVRISKSGGRFLIEGTTIWNLLDESGSYRGQAASFSRWRHL